MDKNNLDLELEFEDVNGRVMSIEVVREVLNNLIPLKDEFYDIIITLCHAFAHPDLTRQILNDYCEDFVFEMTIEAKDLNEEWIKIYEDFGILPLFYIQCPAEDDFEEYCAQAKKALNSMEGRCRAVVFVPADSKQLEQLPKVYDIVNTATLKACFMRLKFRRIFEVSEKALEVYHNFIDKILPEYVLFSEDNVQYYNVNNNVRFRTLECPKNYIYRLRLGRNSNAMVVMPGGELHHIGMTEKFFPGKLEIQPKVTSANFDFRTRNFNLKEGLDRFAYKFVNKNCENCRLKEYCHIGAGDELEVPDDFCRQMQFFSYGYFQLKDWGETRKLEKYPVRFPVRGTDPLGMAATISQIGENLGLMGPVKVVPGKQVRLKSNIGRLSELIEFEPRLLSWNIIFSLIMPKYKEQILALGISEERINEILDFCKKYQLRVYPRDLGIYEGQLYIYNFVPVYRDFEQIDNLLFDSKTKKRVPKSKKRNN